MDVTYYPSVAVSCTSFLVIYRYVSPKLSSRYFPAYNNMNQFKQYDWNSRVNSTVHSIMVSLLCLYVLVYEDEVSRNPVWANSNLVKHNCAIVVGYMLSDSILIILNFREKTELYYLVHHVASIYAYFFVMTYGALPWFANFRLIAEFSTPFVNQRWFLDVLGYPKTSHVFLLNGVAMAVMFFLVRIACIPPYWYKVYTIYGTEPCVRLGRIWYVLLSSCLILDTMNIYWFCKIFKGAQKVLKTNMDKNRNTIDRKVA